MYLSIHFWAWNATKITQERWIMTLVIKDKVVLVSTIVKGGVVESDNISIIVSVQTIITDMTVHSICTPLGYVLN